MISLTNEVVTVALINDKQSLIVYSRNKIQMINKSTETD